MTRKYIACGEAVSDELTNSPHECRRADTQHRYAQRFEVCDSGEVEAMGAEGTVRVHPQLFIQRILHTHMVRVFHDSSVAHFLAIVACAVEKVSTVPRTGVCMELRRTETEEADGAYLP